MSHLQNMQLAKAVLLLKGKPHLSHLHFLQRETIRSVILHLHLNLRFEDLLLLYVTVQIALRR